MAAVKFWMLKKLRYNNHSFNILGKLGDIEFGTFSAPSKIGEKGVIE